jgi:hypothetical protein
MKIQKNKDNSINEESKSALINFRKNQINSNIKLHKIFLVLVILLNIGLLFFILFDKSKISQIKSLSNSHTSEINSEDTHLVSAKSSLYKKMVNIASIGSFGSFRFSFIFDKSEQFQHVKKLIYDYKKEIGAKVTTIDEMETMFLYQGITDSDNLSDIIDKLSFFEGLVFLFNVENGKKFGIYHKEILAPNKKHVFDSPCKDVFLFTFDSDKIYKFNGKKYSMHFNNDQISLGDNEFIIYNEYFNNGGFIDFPLKSFDFSTVNKNILTGENGKFTIRNIEVFCFVG